MKILYGSGNVLVSKYLTQGSSTQITGFVSALEQAGHSILVDLSGNENVYPKIKTKKWLKWIKAHISLSWLVYEVLQILNNRNIKNRLNEIKLEEIDLLWQRYELFTTAYSDFANTSNIPNVLFFDAPLIIERQQFGHLWLKRLAIKVLRYNVKKADLIVAISQPVAEYIREYVGIQNLPIHIMPNGFPAHILNVDSDEVDKIKKRYFGDFNGVVIGFVGSIKPWHKVEYLIQVAFQLSQERDDFRVLIVGDGAELFKQKNLVHQLELDKYVKFTGSIPFEKIGNYLHVLDIGVMPDSNLYGSPMKIPEYMACKVAVVAPNLPPIVELCQHEETALLFSKDDIDEFYNAVRKLLDDTDLRCRLRNNAYELAMIEYSWESRIKQLNSKFIQVLF